MRPESAYSNKQGKEVAKGEKEEDPFFKPKKTQRRKKTSS
jgi:hypothetical protein